MVRKKILFIAASLLAAVGTSFGAYAAYLQVVGNFHTVIDGEVYRSAQPTTAELNAYVKEHGIKTVINLRGSSNDSSWYRDEIKTSQELGVKHIDFRMSASQVLSPERIDEITAIMASAPKPILIHCQSGSDRTGLVSAIYAYRIAGETEDAAEGQLSFYYGHVGIPVISSAWAMDKSWETLEHRANNSVSNLPNARG